MLTSTLNGFADGIERGEGGVSCGHGTQILGHLVMVVVAELQVGVRVSRLRIH